MPPAPEGVGGTSSDRPALTLVVPAFNEAPRLSAGIARLRDAASTTGLDLTGVELLVVNDGSTDGTGELAAREIAGLPLARILAFPHRLGKGAAVRTGVLAARGHKVAFADADMSIDPVHLPQLLAALDRADLAVGTRARGGRVDYGSPLRTQAGRAFNVAVRRMGGVRLADTQCGFKGFNLGPALLLAHLQTTSGYAFDVELLWLSSELGLRVEEVPVTWLDVPGSSVRPHRHAARMLADVLAARRRHRYLAAAELSELPGVPLPASAVLVELQDRDLLCGSLAQLGPLRRAVGSSSNVRCLTFEELVSMRPRTVVAASERTGEG